ncbi:MAG: hypothetical protein K8I27_09195 [Planctomycetes bacterium]|nr:hypothetical protein [Planctomycetota bacterium]
MSAEIGTLTGRQAVELALRDHGVNVEFIGAGDVRRNSSRLFQLLRGGTPSVIVIEALSVESLDVMALRWIFPGGITPLVLCPSNVFECAELAGAAASAAGLLNVPVFLLLDQQLAEQIESGIEAAPMPELKYEDVPPIDALELPEAEVEMRLLEQRLSRLPGGLPLATLDASPGAMGRPEWLVVTYGATAHAASRAVAEAREGGQRVSMLNLKVLWPLPESELLRASTGIKHVVVAERNLGQYAQEIRRVLPDLAVVSAGNATGPVPQSLILRSLQRTPRCC